MMYKWIYLVGQNLRNPSLKYINRFLAQSQGYSLVQLESFQLKKLKELVAFAYQHSSYYRNAFEKANLKPSSIKSLADLQQLPLITKQELITYQSAIATNYSFKKLFRAKTSGTSGESLVFMRNEYADSFNRAVIQFNYGKYGIKPWDRNGYFWGFNSSLGHRLKTRFLDGLQNRFRVFSYSKKELYQFIKKLNQAKYIHGYSSAIYETAKAINANPSIKPRSLMMVKGTSEKIFDFYQPEIIQAFGTKMISEYGAAEAGIIAFECPHGNMHLNMEGVIVEEINNEIVVTNLHMLSFPILRYKLGDYIKLAPRDSLCPCGKRHLILKEVMGRIGSAVYGKKQMYPSLYFYYIFKNLSENHQLDLDYQVLQQTKGNLTFKIASDLSPFQIKLLKTEIKAYFQEDMTYTIETKARFQISNGKKISFISTVDDGRD